MPQLINHIRYFHYISHVLEGQQTDPLCCKCKAFANTANRLEEGLADLESNQAGRLKDLSGDMRHMLTDARSTLAALKLPQNAEGQKKAGNCKMPEGVCFVKIAKAVLDKI